MSINPKKTRPPIKVESNGIAYESGATGVSIVHDDGTADEICGPIRFSANRKTHGGDSTKVDVIIKDYDGVLKTLTVPRSDCVNPIRLLDKLVDCGLDVHDNKLTIQFLGVLFRERPPTKTVLELPHPGWCAIPPSRIMVYATERKVFGSKEDVKNAVLAAGVSSGFTQSGSVAEWNKNVGRYCIGNPHMQLAVCIALASPLLKLSGIQNYGVLLFGDAKTGKTSALGVAGSVIGDFDYVLNWNSTANALEVIAISRTDGTLILDEIGQGNPKEVADAVYRLMNGQAKNRLGQDTKLNAGKRFVGLVLASGEHDLRAHLAQAHIDVKQGQLVRLISVPVYAENGVFHKLHGHGSGQELGKTLAENIKLYHGSLAPAFIEHLVENQDEIKASISESVKEMTAKLLDSLQRVPDPGIYGTVAQSFALAAVAGEMAIENDLLTWLPGDAEAAVIRCFKAWARHHQKQEANSDAEILRHVKGILKGGIFVPLSEFDADEPAKPGYQSKVDKIPAFLIDQDFFESDMCGRFGSTNVIRAIKRCEMLMPGARNTPTRQIHIPKDKQQGKEKVGFYVVKKEILRA